MQVRDSETGRMVNVRDSQVQEKEKKPGTEDPFMLELGKRFWEQVRTGFASVNELNTFMGALRQYMDLADQYPANEDKQ